MKRMTKLIGILLIMTMVLFLVGCSSEKQQETTMEETEEYTGEPIEFGKAEPKISKKEAKSIAKDSLISYFDTCDKLYDYDFYKIKVKSEDDDNYRVQMFTHVSWDWRFIGGDILTQEHLYMCNVDKYTGDISDKSDPNWEKEDY